MYLCHGCKAVYPLTIILALVTILIAGCKDDEPPPTKPSEDIIYRAEGGSASLSGHVTVDIPPQAISMDTKVQIETIDTYPVLPDSYGLASLVYDISLSVGEVVDTVWITMTYQEGQLPPGLLESSLLTGRIAGSDWVFENPTVIAGENHTRLGVTSLGSWAVVWKAQDPKSIATELFDGIIEDVGSVHRADFELALGEADAAEIVGHLQGYKNSLDAASADDPVVANAILRFLDANRAIENDGNVIDFYTAGQLATAYGELGLATGFFSDLPAANPPQLQIGPRRMQAMAFAEFFRHYPGYDCLWTIGKAGHLQATDSVEHDFFVQLNFDPTFGGLTYLDPPGEIERETRVLDLSVTGPYRLNLVRATTSSNKTVYYDYFRDRGIVLYWPMRTETILFNFASVDNAVDAVAYAIEFGDLLIDFQVVRDNPFSAEAQTDSLGSWLYLGLPVSAVVDLFKQDGRLVFMTESGGLVERDVFLFPVNRRPYLNYGDWTAPAAIDDLEAAQYWGNSVLLHWTAPGNDLDSGTATIYDLRYSTAPIDLTNWDQAIPIDNEPDPAEAGTEQELLLLPFDLSSTIYMAIQSRDLDFNYSEISNILQLYNLGELAVEIPDANLDVVIRNKIAKPSGTIYAADIASLTELVASSKGIIHIEGLEYLPNILTLNLSSNLQIYELAPLAHLIQLQRISLAVNDIWNLSSLAGLGEMRTLLLASNRISDLLPLAGMVKLDTLSLRYNSITDIRSLKDLANLVSLDLGHNRISDISILQGLENLKTLILDRNAITDLSPLLANPGLGAGDTVDVRDNPLSADALETQIPQLQARGVIVLFDPPEG